MSQPDETGGGPVNPETDHALLAIAAKTDSLMAATAGYRQKALVAGFTQVTAEALALEFHAFLFACLRQNFRS